MNSLKILMVEDNPICVLVLHSLLNKLNYDNIAVADNGQDALDVLKKEKFDIIFMDIQLPVLSGDEIIKKIRTDPEFEHIKDVPIIVLTAYALKGDKEKFLKAGADDYMSKPYYKEELINILSKYDGEMNERLEYRYK